MFQNRKHAGLLLAEHLMKKKKDLKDVLVFALPRGGVVVAQPIAEMFKTTLYPLVVRKIGAPDHEEFAIGALGENDELIMNNEVISSYGFEWDQIEPIVDRERKELKRRLEKYRGGKPLPKVKGKTVLIVDDGLATGTTMLVCIRILKKLGAKVIVAVPVGSQSAIVRVKQEADEVIAIAAPPYFQAVGQYYDSFPQTGDSEVLAVLEENRNFVAKKSK
jgi:predicted phosphoribosyltransferase